MKVVSAIESQTPRVMRTYAMLCGLALARAHDKAGDAAMLAGYLGTKGHFDQAIGEWVEGLALHGETWFVRPTDSGPGLSRAGLWYAWISLPLFQFILIRWWYRLILWGRFLFLVSRLDLDLTPSNCQYLVVVVRLRGLSTLPSADTRGRRTAPRRGAGRQSQRAGCRDHWLPA